MLERDSGNDFNCDKPTKCRISTGKATPHRILHRYYCRNWIFISKKIKEQRLNLHISLLQAGSYFHNAKLLEQQETKKTVKT